MSTDTRLTTLEATLTFSDGQSAKILVRDEVDSAWGNNTRVLGRTVDIREAIVDALRERELFAVKDPETDRTAYKQLATQKEELMTAPTRDEIRDELVSTAIDDPDTGWLSDIAGPGLVYDEKDEVLYIDYEGGIDIGHLASIIQKLNGRMHNA